MFRTSDMVRAGGGRLMKIVAFRSFYAECLWFDGRGRVHVREFDIDSLNPLGVAAGPRTLWPEVTDIPEELLTPAPDRKKKSRKPKRSRRIKRGIAS
jgi:uncharacterized protein YodC (DUF2158 family)